MPLHPASPRLFVAASLVLLAPACGGNATGAGQDAGSDHAMIVPDTGPPDTGKDVGRVDAPGDAPAEVAVDTGADVDPLPSVPKGLVTIPLGGCIPEYTAEVTIGGKQVFNLVVDTGSTTLGVASNTCSNCTGIKPLYTPGVSAT